MIDSNTLFSTLKNFSEWYILFSVFVSAPVPTCSYPTAVLRSWISVGPLRFQHAHNPQPCWWAVSLRVRSGSDMHTPHSHVAELSLFGSTPAPTCSHPTAVLLSWVSLCLLQLRHAHTPQPCCSAVSLWVRSGSDMLTPHSHVALLSLFESAPAPTCSQAVLEIFPT